MTGEDKMNRIFVYIGIIAGLLLGGSLSVEAQKKPLDIEACTSWKRIDAPDIFTDRQMGDLPYIVDGIKSG